MKIQPKNWNEFQHYKDRSPVWIKLHRRILDDYEYHCLPLASKAIAPFLWLLASEYTDGIIEGSDDKIAFRLRVTVKEMKTAVEPLITSGFFTMYQDDIEPIASGYQDACLEKRREETEKEKRERKNMSSDLDKIPFILEITNLSLGKNFKGSKDAVTNIKKRISEGRTPEDFKTVCINMMAAWGSDPKMSQYLCPETLYGEKFDKYLNMVPVKSIRSVVTENGEDMMQGAAAVLAARRLKDGRGEEAGSLVQIGSGV